MTNVAQTIEVAAESSCERGDVSHRRFETREDYELAVSELRKVVGYQGDSDNHDADTMRCEAWGHAGGCDWRVHISAPRA